MAEVVLSLPKRPELSIMTLTTHSHETVLDFKKDVVKLLDMTHSIQADENIMRLWFYGQELKNDVDIHSYRFENYAPCIVEVYLN